MQSQPFSVAPNSKAAPRKTFMDIDYLDFCWAGDGSEQQVERVFDQMKAAGFDGAIIQAFFHGEAFYDSARFPKFSNVDGQSAAGHDGTGNYLDLLARRLREYDPVRKMLALAQERDMELMPYIRLLDEDPANSRNLFFREHPEYFQLSRCGNFQLVGVPCFNYPEVREHFLQRVADFVEMGFRSIYLGALRFHCFYCTPFIGATALADVYGFNHPIAEEYFRRTGRRAQIDPREEATVTVTPLPKEKRLGDLPQCTVSYKGAPDCDYTVLRRIAGEGMEAFLRELKRRFPHVTVTLEAGLYNFIDSDTAAGSLFQMDPEVILGEGLVNRIHTSLNVRMTPETPSILQAYRQKFPRDKMEIGLFLNDALSKNGGSGLNPPVESVRDYLKDVVREDYDYTIIHEAAFILVHSQQEAVWQALGEFTKREKERGN